MISLLTLVVLSLVLTLPVQAMPPHPDLLRKIRNHEIPEPYYLQHRQELLARGVEAPGPNTIIERLRQRSLDEDINIIVILVDFSDHGARTDPGSFDSLLYGSHTGTLRDYYSQVSYGRLNLVTLNMPSALGWQRAPHTYSYYVDGQNGFGTYPQNAQRLAEDAVSLVDPFVDFAPYDNDGDGQVDALFIIHTGPGAERTGSGSDIWSHKWQMAHPANVDGVTASVYSMEPEYWSNSGDMTCGVYAHEMGHSVFGLPDLYDTDYDSEGLGTWSLMAGGSWNGALGASPSNPDAWCRVQMGFANPVNVTANQSHVAIPCVENSPQVFRLWTDGQQSSEYFLVENRQQTGYDHTLPGNGLMIYHIDDTQHNNNSQWFPGHTDQGNYHVALEQADGLWQLEQNTVADPGDPYPGMTENYTFSVSSTPSSETYGLADSHVGVRHIGVSADTMFASFYVNSSLSGTPVFISLPDTSAAIGNAISVPLLVENELAGRSVTSFHCVVHYDSTLLTTENPVVSRTGGVVPASWTLSAVPSGHNIAITASGATALNGHGTLVFLHFRAASAAVDRSVSPLSFESFAFNQGTPSADTTNGSLMVLSPRVEPQPALLDLGVIRLGTGAGNAAFVIRNSGSANLIIDSLRVPAFLTTDFHGPATVVPSWWHAVRAHFTFATVGLYQDTMLIYCPMFPEPTVVPVVGRCAVPVLESSVSTLDFDTVAIGQSADRVISLSDSGYWPTTISAVQLASGAAFRVVAAPQWPDTVPSRGTLPVTVRFTAQAGLVTDTLIFTHDAGDPLRIVLRGVGAALGANDPNNMPLPTVFKLSSAYPNPFNPSTTVRYDVPRAAWVTLTVYDVLGRAVDVPISGMMQPGRYSISWTCPQCGSGLYFFVLSADGLRLTQKAMLLR